MPQYNFYDNINDIWNFWWGVLLQREKISITIKVSNISPLLALDGVSTAGFNSTTPTITPVIIWNNLHGTSPKWRDDTQWSKQLLVDMISIIQMLWFAYVLNVLFFHHGVRFDLYEQWNKCVQKWTIHKWNICIQKI